MSSDSGLYSEKELEQFDRWNVPRPSHLPHGTDEDIRKNLKPMKAMSWRLEGNKLIAETEFGPVVNFLPTEYIMEGIDEKGLPKLRKLDI